MKKVNNFKSWGFSLGLIFKSNFITNYNIYKYYKERKPNISEIFNIVIQSSKDTIREIRMFSKYNLDTFFEDEFYTYESRQEIQEVVDKLKDKNNLIHRLTHENTHSSKLKRDQVAIVGNSPYYTEEEKEELLRLAVEGSKTDTNKISKQLREKNKWEFNKGE